MTDYSRIRQRISQLRHEEEILLDTLMKPPKMARGTITWHKNRGSIGDSEKLYPGLIRRVGGKSVGRRVRVGHLEWLEPLLGAHREYRQGLQRVRAIHGQIERLLDELRYEHLYDYEARMPGYLVPVAWEGKDVEK
jgi:hypothetical protein